jgi:hypothetical protein
LLRLTPLMTKGGTVHNALPRVIDFVTLTGPVGYVTVSVTLYVPAAL